jgi:hypothetical protein
MFKTCLAFVRKINSGCWRPVTREDPFKRQRWDLKAMNNDRLRRKAERKKAAAEEEDEEDDDEDNSSSSSEEEGVEEEDKGVAHEGQL